MFNFLKKILFLTFICSGLGTVLLFAQLDNQSLEEPVVLRPERVDELWLQIQNFNFLRNNEYFNPIVSGETFLGTQLSGSLLYAPSPNLQLEAGVFLLQDFGSENFRSVKPLIRLTYQKKATKMIFGNLQANYAHRLIEPLYGFEQGLARHLEQGLQFIHHRPKLYTELWVDWQQTVSAQKDRPERFWVGWVNDLTLVKSKGLTTHISTQATIFHTGGQDLIQPFALGNELNLATGIKTTQTFDSTSFFKKFYVEIYGILSAEQYSGLEEISRTGNALYTNIGLDMRLVHFLFSLWQGNGFNSTQGGDLYKSFSQREGGISQDKRTLLFFRLMKDWKIQEDFSIGLRVEPYYDVENQLWEFNAGLFMVYRPAFRIMRVN